VGYIIEIKKTSPIEDSTHLVEIFNYKLIVYLKLGNKLIRAIEVFDPPTELTSVISEIKKGIDITITNETYKLI
jgi:hypothetical protein